MSNNNKGRKITGVMKLLTFILIITIVLIITLFTTKLTNITVEGNTHYSNEEIIELLKVKETDNNTLLFYLRHTYGTNEEFPFIEKIDIELVDKNQIHVKVYEKVVTGTIEYMDAFMYFDREGIIVETSNEKIDSVPIVSGLRFSNLVMHNRIEVDKPNVFQVILNLTQLIQTYNLEVNEILFTDDLEVVLYCDKVRVLLGKRDSYNEQIAQIPSLLASISEDKEKFAKDKKILIDMKDFEEGQDRIIAIPLD